MSTKSYTDFELSHTLTVGQYASITLASGSQNAKDTYSGGYPPGMSSVNGNTRMLSGTPTATGVYTIIYSAFRYTSTKTTTATDPTINNGGTTTIHGSTLEVEHYDRYTYKITVQAASGSGSSGSGSSGSGSTGGSTGTGGTTATPERLTWAEARKKAEQEGKKIRRAVWVSAYLEYDPNNYHWFAQPYNPVTKALGKRHVITMAYPTATDYLCSDWTTEGVPGQS